MKTEINGIEYNLEIYRHDDQLPNLVMLHGFMGSGRVFEPLVKHLQPFCNPITVDLLGHGETAGSNTPQRFEAQRQIADLHQIILQIDGRPLFMHGYSMGGRLALRYALAHPKTLAGLILESTNYGLKDEVKINRRKQTDEERARAITDDFDRFVDEWQKIPLFQKGITLPDSKRNHYTAIQQKQQPEQMAHSLRGFGTGEMPSVKDQLADCSLPILLIAGQADLKYSEIARQMDKQFTESSLSIIPNAGHRVHLEHPKAFIENMQSFINKTSFL